VSVALGCVSSTTEGNFSHCGPNHAQSDDSSSHCYGCVPSPHDCFAQSGECVPTSGARDVHLAVVIRHRTLNRLPCPTISGKSKKS